MLVSWKLFPHKQEKTCGEKVNVIAVCYPSKLSRTKQSGSRSLARSSTYTHSVP